MKQSNMKKKLIFISGAMCSGKTTIAKILNDRLKNSVWLDGDWCWMQGKKWNFCEENKKMVIDNITYLLKNFLKNPNFDNIIFTWVLHLQEIWDDILKELKDFDFELHKFSLICSEEELEKRLKERSKDFNGEELKQYIKKQKSYIDLYSKLNTIKVDTGSKGAEQSADYIIDCVVNNIEV